LGLGANPRLVRLARPQPCPRRGLKRGYPFLNLVPVEGARKAERRKCPRCFRVEFYDDVPLAMSRLYVKRKKAYRWKWVPVGWICLNCGHVEIDADLKSVKSYKSFIRQFDRAKKPA
jgi:hypothetical protein